MSVSSAEETPRLEEVFAARERIAGVVRRTPLERAEALSEACGSDILLKLECWQPTRSFKIRGAYNAIGRLGPAQRARGLVTASAGNHGQAVALAARELGARATVYVPAAAPAVKRDRIARLGATLQLDAVDYDEAERLARMHAEREGAVFVHAFSDAAVVAGQGTIGLEILEEAGPVTEVLIPVGGGGLLAGVGLVLKALAPDVRVVGVQSSSTRAMYEALQEGRAVEVGIPPTLADGLAGCTDEASIRRVRAVIDELVLVEEPEIADAIAELHAGEGVLAEGAGAVGVAALLTGRVKPRRRAVVIVSGGNIDGATAARILGGRHGVTETA
jgi:threonine dehydratase